MGASQVLEISKPSQIETPIEAGAARLEERTEAGALVAVLWLFVLGSGPFPLVLVSCCVFWIAWEVTHI